MKKILLGIALVIIVVGVAIYLYPKTQSVQEVAPTSTSVKSVSATSTYVFVGQIGLGEHISWPIVNATTGDSISIQGTNQEAQNPSSYIYVNQKKVGVVGGYLSMPSFSPDNKYFAIQETFDEGCASTCLSFDISVINLEKGTISTIQPNPIDAYIDSYTWDDDNALDFTSYSISASTTGNITNYYRTSPEQVWQYELTTGNYTLVNNLP